MPKDTSNTDEDADPETLTEPWAAVDDLSYTTLLSQWRAIVEELRDGVVDAERDATLWDRRTELWNEMADRTADNPPECPECGDTSWQQEFGGPKSCSGCGFHPGEGYTDLRQDIDAYWNTVLSEPDSDADTSSSSTAA